MIDVVVSCMTIALILYIVAFIIAKNSLKMHIALALLGFALDLYATYLMEVYRLISSTNYLLLHFHIVISVAALAAFMLQMMLGIFRKKRAHVFSAKYIFFPIWIVSYLSGMALIAQV